MTITVLDPTHRQQAPRGGDGGLAPRPASLEGCTVGLLINRLADCDRMFEVLGRILVDRYGAGDVLAVTKDSQSVPPTEDQWASITTADVVVTGFGGCGSCSTRSMRDALDLEERGIPAVCVGHAALRPGVRLIAEIAGRPDYEMVTIDYPHPPIARWEGPEANDIAESLVAHVVDRLTA